MKSKFTHWVAASLLSAGLLTGATTAASAHAQTGATTTASTQTREQTRTRKQTPAQTHARRKPVPSRAAEMKKAALTLENALMGLNTNRVDLLYAYLQSIPLNNFEVAKIKSNAHAMQMVVDHSKGAAALTRYQKIELLRLFASSIDYAHLRVGFTYLNGKPLNILTYKFNSHILVLLENERGQALASMRPHPADLSSSIIVSYVRDVDTAVQAAYKLEQYHHFVAMPRM